MFEFFDHTGDVGVHLRAESLGELFDSAAQALTDTVTDVGAIGPVRPEQVSLRGAELDLLLVDWLSELLYRFEVSRFLSRSAEVAINRSPEGWHLEAVVMGEDLDLSRHPVKVAVKAVTYHALSVDQDERGWRATMVFDI